MATEGQNGVTTEGQAQGANATIVRRATAQTDERMEQIRAKARERARKQRERKRAEREAQQQPVEQQAQPQQPVLVELGQTIPVPVPVQPTHRRAQAETTTLLQRLQNENKRLRTILREIVNLELGE